eukprot:gene24505-10103_t
MRVASVALEIARGVGVSWIGTRGPDEGQAKDVQGSGLPPMNGLSVLNAACARSTRLLPCQSCLAVKKGRRQASSFSSVSCEQALASPRGGRILWAVPAQASPGVCGFKNGSREFATFQISCSRSMIDPRGSFDKFAFVTSTPPPQPASPQPPGPHNYFGTPGPLIVDSSQNKGQTVQRLTCPANRADLKTSRANCYLVDVIIDVQYRRQSIFAKLLLPPPECAFRFEL